MSAFNLPVDEIATDTPVFDDAAGNVTASPDGALVGFTPGDASLVTMVVSPDGKSATFTPVGPFGSYTYSVSATRADGSALGGYSQELVIAAGAAVSVAPGLTLAPKA